jgi:hypothetical protein
LEEAAARIRPTFPFAKVYQPKFTTTIDDPLEECDPDLLCKKLNAKLDYMDKDDEDDSVILGSLDNVDQVEDSSEEDTDSVDDFITLFLPRMADEAQQH